MASSIVIPFTPNEKKEDQKKTVNGSKYQRKKYEENKEAEYFLEDEDEDDWDDAGLRKKQATRMVLELVLLKGAFSFDAIHHPPPQHELLQLDDPHAPSRRTSFFLKKDGCVDHSVIATHAVDELSSLALDKDGLFWTHDGLLNQLHYQQTFPKLKKKMTSGGTTPGDDDHDANSSSSWSHASRASAIVKMEPTRLANKFTLDKDWEQLFPSVVTKSTSLRFLSPKSSSSNPDGSVQLIQIQLQATTPIVPEKKFVILRTCKKIDQSTWVVADVSVDSSLNLGYPCGCLIQGIADGSSQVTWVEHLEFKESSYLVDPKLYYNLCCRGFAFGAQRWVACLERACERRCFYRLFDWPHLLPGKCVMEYEKKCVMRLSERMVRDFCLNIGPPFGRSQRSSCVPEPCQARVSLKRQNSPYHDDDPREIVLLATTTFSLPHSPDLVLKIIGDDRRRHELDASGKIGRVTDQVACYATGGDPRNKICVQANRSFGNDQLLIQETSVSPSAGSLVVWSLVKSEPYGLARLGENPPLIGLSGVAISNSTDAGSGGDGSIVTLGLQQEARYMKGLWPNLEKSVMKCMQDTVHRIVEALNNHPKDDQGVHSSSTNKRKRDTDEQDESPLVFN